MRFPKSLAMLSTLAAASSWVTMVSAQATSPDLSSGGLAPPPAVESEKAAEQPGAPAGGTEQELATAEREDSGRGLEFVWVVGEVGVGHFGLGALDTGDLLLANGDESKQSGLVAGAGLGIRIIYLTAGARFRYAPLPDVTLWTLGAEGGLHIPIGALEPYFTLGLGYVNVKGKEGPPGIPAPAAQGFDGRLGAGIDFYFTNMFSVGANLTGDVLVLSGDKVPDVPDADGSGALPAENGSSVGAGVTLTAVMGLHF
jgi:opacity protein-like surface antigen